MCALPGRLLEARGAEGRWVQGEPSRVKGWRCRVLSAAWTRRGDSKGFVVPAAGGGWRLAAQVTEAGAAPSTRTPFAGVGRHVEAAVLVDGSGAVTRRGLSEEPVVDVRTHVGTSGTKAKAPTSSCPQHPADFLLLGDRGSRTSTLAP